MNEEFVIKTDGTIERKSCELDAILLNIIRIGANKDDVLAAYRAQKKCYKICKKTTRRIDYREYVQCLQLDNFPIEFKKAELGRTYKRQFMWLIPPGFIFVILLFPLFYARWRRIANDIKNAM